MKRDKKIEINEIIFIYLFFDKPKDYFIDFYIDHNYT